MKAVGILAFIFAIAVTIGSLAFCGIWFFAKYGPGQIIASECSVSGMGEGACYFSNTGTTPGTTCIEVKLVNVSDNKEATSPARTCSGRVWPNDTVEKHITIIMGNVCKDDDHPLQSWSDNCHMEVTELP